MDRKRLFHALFWLITFIFIANALANKFYWYSSIWYFDIVMHFLGGFWVGLFALYMTRAEKISRPVVLRVMISVIVIGVGWEIFELMVDKVISRNAFNILDSTADLFFDSAGGAAAVLYYLKNFGRSER
jgi:hypothetical protein